MNTQRSTQTKGTLLMILATFLWGSSFVVTKNATDNFPPFLLVAIRTFFGGLSVLPFCWKNRKDINRNTILVCLLLGFLYAGGMIFQTFGIKYTNSGRTAFLTAAYCIIMPYLEWLFLKSKPKAKNIFASLCCVIGIGLVAINEALSIDSGDVYSLIGSLCFGLFIVLLSVFLKKIDAAVINSFQLMFAGLILFTISIFVESPPTTVTKTVILDLFYISILCTGFPLLFQSYAQKNLSPTLITIILGFEAIFASALSSLFNGEEFSIKCIIGFAMIILSVFIGEIDFKAKD